MAASGRGERKRNLRKSRKRKIAAYASWYQIAENSNQRFNMILFDIATFLRGRDPWRGAPCEVAVLADDTVPSAARRFVICAVKPRPAVTMIVSITHERSGGDMHSTRHSVWGGRSTAQEESAPKGGR